MYMAFILVVTVYLCLLIGKNNSDLIDPVTSAIDLRPILIHLGSYTVSFRTVQNANLD